MLIGHGLIRGDVDVVFRCGVKARLSPSAYSWLANAYRDGLIKRVEVIAYLWDVARVFINGDALFIMPDGVKLKYIDPFTTAETWLCDVHFLGFDLTNWLVVDVGAYVGDTALYYAKRGAFVIAIEPVPTNYEAMLRNIELNPGLKPRILPINAAIADKDDYVNISYDGEFDGAASIYEVKRFKVKVRSIKPGTLIKEVSRSGIDLSRFKVKVLKMDCRGCGWDIVSNELEVIRSFDIVKIEYSGYLRNYIVDELLNKIKSIDFKCRIWAHNDIAVKIGLNKHGTITCFKRDFNYMV
jgi:FkbM family methyltransferase